MLEILPIKNSKVCIDQVIRLAELKIRLLLHSMAFVSSHNKNNDFLYQQYFFAYMYTIREWVKAKWIPNVSPILIQDLYRSVIY